MSKLDEARYGRACLLLLNICPFTLRRVIDDYYMQHGFVSLQDFLDKHKHDLFHLLLRRCCCRPQQSKITPMHRYEWDLLYIKNTSTCCKGQRGDCPRQYDAKPGITTDVMDVTLSCFIIKNVCPTINMTHIDTIRDIRNKLIHATSASLDEITFKDYWKKVKKALSDLATLVHIFSTLEPDTKKKMKELKIRVMDPDELGELRKLIIDQRKFTVLELRVTDVEKDLDSTNESITRVEENMNQTTEKVTEIEGSVNLASTKLTKIEETVSQTAETSEKVSGLEMTVAQAKRKISKLEEVIEDQGREIKVLKEDKVNPSIEEKSDEELMTNIEELRKRLQIINDDMTKKVPINPLQEEDEEMPIELLYASVVIREDPKYAKRGIGPNTQSEIHTRNSEADDDSSQDSDDDSTSSTSKTSLRKVKDPDDILKIDGRIARNIYMLGDAAHGKTTYCLWLLRKWCNAQHGGGLRSEEVDKWEAEMSKFDFVFLLQLRYMNPNRTSIIDMICQDVFGRDKRSSATIRHVLSSEEYRSLIILDGMDEWNPNGEARKHLTCEAIPNIEGVAINVSCFITMRPWLFPTLSKSKLVKAYDRVIEIRGLSKTGMKDVIKNVLLNYYNLKEDKLKYTSTYQKIEKHLGEKNLKSFMQIPLLAVVCVQIWYEGKQMGDSMASFYAVMIDMLIERAYQKHKLETSHEKAEECRLPDFFSERENIQSCFHILFKLGKVAFESLLSAQTNLIFQKRKLEKEIGVRELQFALDVGLISQREAPGILTKNVNLHFFHKSIQEFLAATYFVTHEEKIDSFINKHLSNVEDIMKLSNVIMFICGICPSLGSIISQHVVYVTDSDNEICEYRETPKPMNKVRELYTIQTSWYREFQHAETDRPVTFHVSDVYLWHSGKETVMRTKELMFNHHHHEDIRSVFLWGVPTDGEDSITNKELSNFLSNAENTRSLIMIFIDGEHTDRSVHKVALPTVKFLYLSFVKVHDIDLCGNFCPPLLRDMKKLHRLELYHVTLGERGLGLSADMVHINAFEFGFVKMSAAEWNKFVLTLIQLQQRTEINLFGPNIDDESLSMIRSSPHFNISSDRLDVHRIVNFTTVWPLT